MQRSAKIAMAASALVILGGAFAFWWFVLRDDAPPPAALPVRTAVTTTTGAGGQQIPGAPVEGTWTLSQASDVFVGYRIQELFAGETISKTAVGRTPAVTGTLTIADGQVVAAEVTADVTQLSSDQSQRDNFTRRSALETDEIPSATFSLTEPIALPQPVEVGDTMEVSATGDLTLHGVTRPVQIPLQASWNGSTISVAGGLHIVLADYAIEPPDIALVSVEEEGELELQLVFGR